ncbi:hypothetical protein Tco_1369941 [Tanacetum coccineum]
MCDGVRDGLKLLVGLNLQAVCGPHLVLNKVVEMISYTSKDDLRKRPVSVPRPSYCIRAVANDPGLSSSPLCLLPIWLDQEIDLFAFINHADPTKVRIGEKQIEEGQTLLLESTRGRVVLLAGVNEQGNQNDDVQDAGAHVVQDEGVNIVADEEVEATVADKPKGLRKKRKAARGASGSSLPSKNLREDHGTFDASTGGKSVTVLQSLLERNTLDVEVGVTAVSMVLFVTSSVTLTPEREGGRRTDSVTRPNLRTQHPAKRFVVLLDSPCHSSSNSADAEVSSVVRSLILDPPIMTTTVATTVVVDISSVLVPKAGDEPVHASIFADSTSIGTVGPDIAGPSQPAGTELSANTFYLSQDMDSETLRHIYVHKCNVVNESALDDPDVCRSLVDQLAPLVLFSQLRGMDYDQLFAEFNVGAARQTCLSAEVRMRTEHILREKKKLEGRCEAEAAETIRLRGQVFVAEAAEAARLSFDELNVKTASFESQKDNLTSQVSSLEATCIGLRDQVKILSDKVAGLDAELMRMALHLDKEFYPRFLTTIAGRRWILSCGFKLVVMKCLQSPEYLVALGKAIGRAIEKGIQNGLEAGIDHGRSGRSLVNIAAYDPFAKANYVSAVHALHGLDFPLLSQLESRKDASIADIMSLLHLEGPTAETPEASQLQPSIKGDAASCRLSLSEAMVPLIEPLFAENLVGEASTSNVLATTALNTALSTTFAPTSSVHSVLVSNYEVLDAKPQTEAPPSALVAFEKEELETTP